MGIAFNRNYICVFCDERVRKDNVHIKTGGICICRTCTGNLVKNAPAMPFDGVGDVSYIISPFEYDGTLRDTILKFKFDGSYAYAKLYAEMMKDHLASYDIWRDFDYIVPVPLHNGRLKERGYNQSELIAKYISKYIGVPLRTDLAKRIRATERQSRLHTIVDRIENMKDAFECSGKVKGKRIILFDDICTSGNTLRACAKPLKEAGAESICALTLSINKEAKLSWLDVLNSNVR